MQRNNRVCYQNDEIIEKIPETYEKYDSYAIRNFSIFNNWRKGDTYESIGKHYGLSKQRIAEIVQSQCHRYNCIKRPPKSAEQAIVQHHIKKIVDVVDYNAKGSTRLFNCLARHFKENIHDPDWNAYKAISEMTDEEFLSLRSAGLRTLPVFHEVRDEARRRLEESGNEVDTDN